VKRIAVIGLGTFGMGLARALARFGAQVIAVDDDMAHVRRIKEEAHAALRMDARDRDSLEAQGIHEVDVAVVCMGEDFEAAEICAVHLFDLGCPRVLVRGTSKERVEILQALGPEVITPGLHRARELAVSLVAPGLLDYADLLGEEDVALARLSDKANDLSLGDLKLEEKTKARVLALRRGEGRGAEIFVGPGPSHALREGDFLFLLGTEAELVKAGQYLA